MEEQTNDQSEAMKIDVDAAPEVRRGVYANLVMAATLPNGIVQLNFVGLDNPNENGTMGGVLASRVYMAPPDVVALRDMLIKHTQSWKVDTDDTKA